MRSDFVSTRVAVLVLLFVSSIIRADSKPGGTVTGHGSVEIKRQPEYLRVHLELLARGKDVGEALAKLRDRRHSAQKHLEQLGAASVEFAKPIIVEERNDRQQRQMMMMMRQMNQGKKPVQKSKEPPPIIVSCALKAEIKLTATEPEELLVVAHALEEGIKLADLGGIKDLKHASPQDEEQEQEEGAEMMMNFGHSEGLKRGEPVFSYVSKVSEGDQLRARAEAFKKAEREAGRLAKAAGVELGPIYHLEDTSASTNPWDESAYMDSSYSYRWQQIMNMRGAGHWERTAGEAIGLQATAVSYRVALSASFELKTPGGK
jgi:uncharacterized protein YggE